MDTYSPLPDKAKVVKSVGEVMCFNREFFTSQEILLNLVLLAGAIVNGEYYVLVIQSNMPKNICGNQLGLLGRLVRSLSR